jgi:hypothetical protein
MLLYGTQSLITVIKVHSPLGADNLFEPSLTLHLSKFEASCLPLRGERRVMRPPSFPYVRISPVSWIQAVRLL